MSNLAKCFGHILKNWSSFEEWIKSNASNILWVFASNWLLEKLGDENLNYWDFTVPRLRKVINPIESDFFKHFVKYR